MTYETFKHLVKEKLPEFLPEEYHQMEVHLNTVPKVNHMEDVITILERREGKRISPSLYLYELYQDYVNGMSYEECMYRAADFFSTHMGAGKEILEEFDLSNMRDRIVFQMINKAQNKELLEIAPHRDFLDGALIYLIQFESSLNGTATAIIHNNMMEKIGLTEKELFDLAYKNTRELTPPDIRSMEEILFAIDAEIVPFIPVSMYVLTNESRINGAACLIYEDLLCSIANKANSDLIILPSSIHESLIVFDSLENASMYAPMVYEVNMNEVELSERLSNDVYGYDREKRELFIATNVPNKRLDGKDLEVSRELEKKAYLR